MVSVVWRIVGLSYALIVRQLHADKIEIICIIVLMALTNYTAKQNQP
jgi:hypothetical protein